jgi:hypothetical protein
MTSTRRGFATQAPAVMAALAAAIATEIASAHEATPSSLGYPAGGLGAEHIWVSGEFDCEMPRYVSGGLQRDETGKVEVRISVKWSDADMVTVIDRAVELAQIVEDAVSTDPTLGGVVTTEAHVSSARGAEAIPDEHSRQYGLAMWVAYQTTVALS